MKKTIAFLVTLFVVIGLTGCPGKEQSNLSDGDKKFTLSSDKEVSIPQGGASTVTINATRKGFDEDVKITIDKLPDGVKIDGGDIVIAKGVKEFKVTFKADADAKAISGHTATVQGKAGKFEATHKLNVNVTEKKTAAVDNANVEIEKKRAEAKAWYEGQKTEFDNRIGNLKKRADATAGDAKANINKAIRELQDKKSKLDETYAHAKDKTMAAWDEFYTGLKKAGSELSEATDKALKEYK